MWRREAEARACWLQTFLILVINRYASLLDTTLMRALQ
jgi:hypothetical protein